MSTDPHGQAGSLHDLPPAPGTESQKRRLAPWARQRPNGHDSLETTGDTGAQWRSGMNGEPQPVRLPTTPPPNPSYPGPPPPHAPVLDWPIVPTDAEPRTAGTGPTIHPSSQDWAPPPVPVAMEWPAPPSGPGPGQVPALLPPVATQAWPAPPAEPGWSPSAPVPPVPQDGQAPPPWSVPQDGQSAEQMWMHPVDAPQAPRIQVLEQPGAQPTPTLRLPGALATLQARNISAWFGDRKVLDRVSLTMPAGKATALIGPSGCGKSTFLRILNRMHELIPSASLAGDVLLDGDDLYARSRRLTDARRQVGMVFQKPNPFPAMSIYDNVVAGLRLTGKRATVEDKDLLVESCLSKAGLWKEVRDRLRQPGGALSGGQQQRLCIARSLAIQPRVLLMDEPCSALDPTSTRRIEQTIRELVEEVTIVIVTHNMQQAARVSDQCAFFLAEAGTPGVIVEHGETESMFNSPQDPRTSDYVNGRFG